MSARFFFARFTSAQQRAAVDWLRAVNELAPRHVGATTMSAASSVLPPDGSVVAWRMVSDNRREIARSCRLFASERDARADISPLFHGASELIVHASPAPRLRSTGWFVTLGPDVRMISARRYESRVTALNAGALAVRLLTTIATAAAEGEDPIEAVAHPVSP